MNFRKILGIFVFIMFITLATFVAFAEEAVVAAPAQHPNLSDSLVRASAQNEADTQWAWGEVTNLDSQAKTLTLKYFDYETDQEKELVLAVDEKTAYENIKSFDEIKVKDTLSIDYAAGPENKNVAKNISLERPDALAAVPQPPAPVIAQPITQPEATGGSSAEVIEPSAEPVPASPAPEPVPATQDQTQ
jgi:hypothetical protein